MNNKNKNIRDMYRGINEFKMGYEIGIELGSPRWEAGDYPPELQHVLADVISKI
jgi:hypothetical protein